MISVSIELWPGGNIRQRKAIHTLTIWNKGNAAPDSEFHQYGLSFDGVEYEGNLYHRREDGLLELVRASMNRIAAMEAIDPGDADEPS